MGMEVKETKVGSEPTSLILAPSGALKRSTSNENLGGAGDASWNSQTGATTTTATATASYKGKTRDRPPLSASAGKTMDFNSDSSGSVGQTNGGGAGGVGFAGGIRRSSSSAVSSGNNRLDRPHLSTATLGSIKTVEYSEVKAKSKGGNAFDRNFPSLGGVPQKGPTTNTKSGAEGNVTDWASRVVGPQPVERYGVNGNSQPLPKWDEVRRNTDEDELERLRALVPKLKSAPKSGSKGTGLNSRDRNKQSIPTTKPIVTRPPAMPISSVSSRSTFVPVSVPATSVPGPALTEVEENKPKITLPLESSNADSESLSKQPLLSKTRPRQNVSSKEINVRSMEIDESGLKKQGRAGVKSVRKSDSGYDDAELSPHGSDRGTMLNENGKLLAQKRHSSKSERGSLSTVRNANPASGRPRFPDVSETSSSVQNPEPTSPSFGSKSVSAAITSVTATSATNESTKRKVLEAVSVKSPAAPLTPVIDLLAAKSKPPPEDWEQEAESEHELEELVSGNQKAQEESKTVNCEAEPKAVVSEAKAPSPGQVINQNAGDVVEEETAKNHESPNEEEVNGWEDDKDAYNTVNSASGWDSSRTSINDFRGSSASVTSQLFRGGDFDPLGSLAADFSMSGLLSVNDDSVSSGFNMRIHRTGSNLSQILEEESSSRMAVPQESPLFHRLRSASGPTGTTFMPSVAVSANRGSARSSPTQMTSATAVGSAFAWPDRGAEPQLSATQPGVRSDFWSGPQSAPPIPPASYFAGSVNPISLNHAFFGDDSNMVSYGNGHNPHDLLQEKAAESMVGTVPPNTVSPHRSQSRSDTYDRSNGYSGSFGSIHELQQDWVMTEEEKMAFWNGVGRGLGDVMEEEPEQGLFVDSNIVMGDKGRLSIGGDKSFGVNGNHRSQGYIPSVVSRVSGYGHPSDIRSVTSVSDAPALRGMASAVTESPAYSYHGLHASQSSLGEPFHLSDLSIPMHHDSVAAGFLSQQQQHPHDSLRSYSSSLLATMSPMPSSTATHAGEVDSVFDGQRRTSPSASMSGYYGMSGVGGTKYGGYRGVGRYVYDDQDASII
ncbi:hypothetical protein HDU76_011333 [Blyttiomyces sp. JEL0837]|nr:hypothetical protein HDU76_011333 [Blyttiomyces sp. JEL0837]